MAFLAGRPNEDEPLFHLCSSILVLAEGKRGSCAPNPGHELYRLVSTSLSMFDHAYIDFPVTAV
jgi:hypothetical protein